MTDPSHPDRNSRDHATREDVELAKVVEREKTIRTFGVGLFSTIGVGMVVYGGRRPQKCSRAPSWVECEERSSGQGGWSMFFRFGSRSGQAVPPAGQALEDIHAQLQQQ